MDLTGLNYRASPLDFNCKTGPADLNCFASHLGLNSGLNYQANPLCGFHFRPLVAEIFHFTTYLGDTLVPLTKLASIAMLALQVSIPQPVPPGINCNIYPSSLNCFVSHLCPNCNAGLPASIATLTFPASTTACPQAAIALLAI